MGCCRVYNDNERETRRETNDFATGNEAVRSPPSPYTVNKEEEKKTTNAEWSGRPS